MIRYSLCLLAVLLTTQLASSLEKLHPPQPLDPWKVSTTHGTLEGFTQELWNGKEVNAFLGVPFADPPLGDDRFAPPRPLTPWTGVLKAKHQPVSCYQAAYPEYKKGFFGLSETTESEDCLYLNVWSPNLRSHAKLPVMIYIYGGGYFGGSANIHTYNGGFMAAEHDVVVATMNYRASFFGFLYLNSTEVPGNAALRDQLEAIKWVKANAEAFGGDPDRITLFGESTGSISTAIHNTNPETADLYRHCIMQSGTLDMPGITQPPEVMLARSLDLASKAGCPTDSAQSCLDCLNSKTPDELLEHVDKNLYYLQIPFVPVRNGREAPLDPTAAVHNVPASLKKSCMSGTIRNDFSYFIANFFPGKTLGEDFSVSRNDWSGLLSAYGLKDSGLQGAVAEVYPAPQGTSNLRDQASACVADSSCECQQQRYTRSWANGANHVYFYHFTHRPSKPLKAPIPTWLGPTHGDDLAFVFGVAQNPSKNYTLGEVELSRKIMAMWTNFAKTGNPNGPGSEFGIWPELKPGGPLDYLELSEHSIVKQGLKQRECDFWEKEFPVLLDKQKQLDQENAKQ